MVMLTVMKIMMTNTMDAFVVVDILRILVAAAFFAAGYTFKTKFRVILLGMESSIAFR